MTTRLPPLNALRAFDAAARHMSVTKAAEELHVTPAAVSHQLRALEQDLGVQLFRRLNRALELTPSARLLLPGLSDGFARLQDAVGRLRAHNDTGALTVTTAPSFAAKWLVLRLHRFQEQHPAIDVRISATDDVIDLTKGEFDIAIRFGAGEYPGLASELLLRNEVFPACSPALLRAGPPLGSPEDLRRHTLIHDLTSEREPLVPSWSMWLKAAGVSGIDAAKGLSFSNSYLAVDAAIAGRGVTLANTTIAAADIAAGRLVRPFALGLPNRLAYYVISLPEALERPKVKAFRDWLRREADAERGASGDASSGRSAPPRPSGS